MSSDEWCEFNDMPKDGCAHCQGVKPEPVEKPLTGPVVMAKMDTTCEFCGEKVEAGVDHIALVIEGPLEGAWVHYGCGR